MSFGTNNDTKRAENNLGGVANAAVNQQLPMYNAYGSGLLNLGGGNVTAGTNLFNTVLGGNRTNTTAALQPSIDQIRQGDTASLNAINTLMPRGGGRSGTLYDRSFAPQSQIQNLFNNVRTTAATTLPQIGLQQEGLAANMFGLGNQSLNTAVNANTSLGGMGLTAQQLSDARAAALGSGLFNLLSMPMQSGSANSLLGNLLNKLFGQSAPGATRPFNMPGGGSSGSLPNIGEPPVPGPYTPPSQYPAPTYPTPTNTGVDSGLYPYPGPVPSGTIPDSGSGEGGGGPEGSGMPQGLPEAPGTGSGEGFMAAQQRAKQAQLRRMQALWGIPQTQG